MATLVRPTAQEIQPCLNYLDSSIPKPFPSDEERLRDELLEELANEKVDLDTNVNGIESSQRSQDVSYDVVSVFPLLPL
jgi:hypothetical protein